MEVPPQLPFAQARRVLMADREAGLAALRAERQRWLDAHGELPLPARCEYAAALIDADLIDEVLEEADAIIRIATQRDDNLHAARGYLTLGVFHWRTHETRRASAAIQKARELVPAGATRVAASIEEADGLIQRALGNLSLAAECLMRARDLAGSSELELQQVRISINLVSIFQHLGDPRAALDEGQTARDQLQDSGDHRSLFILAYNLCASYLRLGRFAEALEEAITAREHQQRAGVQFASVGLDVQFAKVYAHLGRTDDARAAAERVSALPDAAFEQSDRLRALAETGEVFHGIGQLDEADRCFERAFEAEGVTEDPEVVFAARLAHVALWLDHGRVPKAHQWLFTVHDDEAPSEACLVRLLELRARVAAAHSDFEHAYQYERERAAVVARMGEERSRRELRNLQVIHRVKEERAVRAALERSNEELTIQVREQTEALERAQRHEALGRLAGGVAHDFSNLLTVLGGSAQLLGEAIDGTPRTRQLLREMKGAVQRGSRLAERLLAFGSRVDPMLRHQTVGSVLDSMRPLLARLVGERIELQFADELEPAQRDLQVAIDAPQLDAVLMNLALNARDAMEGGGLLTFTLRVLDGQVAGGQLQADQLEPAHRQPAHLVIDVSDTGAGVPESVASSLFEPFATTKATSGGVGLGLSSSLGVMRGMHGTLELVETSAAGTTFRVTLPLASAAEASAPSESNSDLDLAGKRALVIEDDGAVRAILASLLRHLKLDVTEADDGEEALARMLGSTDSLPDVLVCDVSMPRCTGPELVRRLRENDIDLPVLFVSGWHGRHLNLDHVSDPRLDFLEKPVEMGELNERLRALLAAVATRTPQQSP